MGDEGIDDFRLTIVYCLLRKELDNRNFLFLKRRSTADCGTVIELRSDCMTNDKYGESLIWRRKKR